MIRSHWRGWNIVLFEDRGSPHTAEASLELAFSLGIELTERCISSLTFVDEEGSFLGHILQNKVKF
jgi:hypothetical protein